MSYLLVTCCCNGKFYDYELQVVVLLCRQALVARFFM
mgnify:CR=1 FL=1